MTCIQYNDANFRAMFTEFSSTVTYPLSLLQLYWNSATDYISNRPNFAFGINQLTLALNQMTAHLAKLNALAGSGQGTGLMQGATIDKVSIQLTPPPEVNQWQWWLNQTPYGQQLLALLQMVSVGGTYVGSYPTVFTLRR